MWNNYRICYSFSLVAVCLSPLYGCFVLHSSFFFYSSNIYGKTHFYFACILLCSKKAKHSLPIFAIDSLEESYRFLHFITTYQHPFASIESITRKIYLPKKANNQIVLKPYQWQCTNQQYNWIVRRKAVAHGYKRIYRHESRPSIGCSSPIIKKKRLRQCAEPMITSFQVRLWFLWCENVFHDIFIQIESGIEKTDPHLTCMKCDKPPHQL